MKNSIFYLFTILLLFSCKKDDPVPLDNTPAGQTLPTQFSSWAGLFDGNGVGAAVNLTEDIVLLFNIDGDRYAWFEEGAIQVERDMDAPDSHFADLPLDMIGAAVVLNNGQLYVFNGTGDMYTNINFSVGDVDEAWDDPTIFSYASVHPLYIWGVDNSCPFDAITAAWSYSDPGTTCFDATSEQLNIWMISETGDEYTRWAFPNGGTFLETDELENWIAENNCGGPDGLLPFEFITAACRFISPNQIQEIFFGPDGKQFCYYSVSEGVFSDIYNLY
jgi:hypothetical protein